MKTPATTIITGASVVKPGVGISQETVVLEGNSIVQVTAETPGHLLLQKDNVSVVNGEGCFLTPGLIDQHINGALGCDFNQCKVIDAQAVLKKFPHLGITGVCPTIITAPLMDMMTAVNTMDQVAHHWRPSQSRIIGLHLEGPLINPQYRGTHPEEAVAKTLNPADLQSLISLNVKLMSLAPERDPEGIMTRFLKEQEIRVLAGHSGATAEEMQRCMAEGLSGVTHLYNACKPFHHRDPGLVGTALAQPSLTVELIADGVHVHPETIRMTLNAKGMGKIILVSDAMQLAGLNEGSQCRFAGTSVTLKGGRALNSDHQLAGATQLLDQGVRNMVHWKLASFADAVGMASTNVANYLGLGNKLGQIHTGYRADLVLWDKQTLIPKATWIDGHLAYSQEEAYSNQLAHS